MLLFPVVALADHNTTVHQLAWWQDAVNSGKTLYQVFSRYGSAINHADVAWSVLGKVDIKPATPLTNVDLDWNDYTNSTDQLCGYTSYGATRTYIYLNTVYMEPAGDFQEKSCTAHELGHAMGIGDHGAGWNAALMYGHVGTYNIPQAHDKDDYYTRWP
jgi:predicted Zn-dependent protease